ncbi:hypothetical protein [Leifsonia sp. Leaf264]|uniref:hypothetical protein n=1 Tax=Leifsonia sp. Leaf264 TaxID=1736314 RepID=UPI000701F777|nr:hypothetical protein [Leifsonia sp. Leaf264]KQO98667.1 hypothetical protein ASF30_11435 [Leifsonia sp. Leaf264]
MTKRHDDGRLRDANGQYAIDPAANQVPTGLLTQTELPHRQHIQSVCKEAGLEMMVGVFEVIDDREEVATVAFQRVTTDDIDGFYDEFIGPAVDKIEAELVRDNPNEDDFPTADLDAVRTHLHQVSDEAGLDVMKGFFDVLVDRETIADDVLTGVTVEHVEAFYSWRVAPAIGQVQNSLSATSDRF